MYMVVHVFYPRQLWWYLETLQSTTDHGGRIMSTETWHKTFNPKNNENRTLLVLCPSISVAKCTKYRLIRL